jgi:ketosteroid isomerase-like protein
MIVNDPAVVAEVSAAFYRYEKALVGNDVTALTELFWKSPFTLRFGLFENLYGHDAIAGFRNARLKVDLSRTLKNTVITTFGKDYGTANTEFVKHDSGRAGRQSHTWVRTDDGWRIVAAHVSWFTPPPA